ncbi:MAG: hypothetical protein AB1714_06685 [Acidobacteriota bacterium]
MLKGKFIVAPAILVGLMAVSSWGAGALVDPAVLLTKADAEAVLGTPVKDPEATANPMGQKIVHYSPAAQGTKVRYVQISVNQTAAMPERMRKNGMSAPKLFEDSARLLSGVQMLTGFGDKAFWGGSGLKAGAGLHVLKGDVYFSVDVALGSEQADRQAAEKLAKLALSRM